MPIFLLLSALPFIAIVMWQLLVDGPFWWHVAQAQSWQGGIEALALLALLFGAQRLQRRSWRLIATLLLVEVYLRRHGVDLAALVDVIYLEILIALGALVRRLCRLASADSSVEYLGNFVVGLCAWSACAWSVSALGFGSVVQLRWLTLLLVLIALAARPRPLVAFVHARIAAMPPQVRSAYALLFGWIAILFARTAIAIGFDPLWYGLRGEYVLVGDGSVFASSGLVSAVHYAPKLYELLLIPVSALGSASVISGMTLMVFAMLTLTADALLKQHGIVERTARAWIVVACMTIPAISNTALDAKPDLLAALLLMLGWLHGNAFVRERSRAAALWTLCCFTLAVAAKLTAIPYAAALALFIGIAALRERRIAVRSIQAAGDSTRLASVAFSLAIVAAAFVTARTLIVAGVPTIGPDALFHVWQTLGFELTPPAGTINWTVPQHWSDVPLLALDLLFRPEKLTHIVISWTGNIWLWCVVVLAALRWRGTANKSPGDRSTHVVAFGAMATGLALMFCVGYNGVRGSDGNYFVAALMPAVLLGAGAVWQVVGSHPRDARAFLVALAAFALFQAAYSFHSASWQTGTRPFDLDFSRGPHQFRDDNRALLAKNGLGAIAAHLHDQHRPVRVVSCIEDGLDFRLPARSESVDRILFSRWQYVGREGEFAPFLKNARIDFLLVPTAMDGLPSCLGWPKVEKVAREIASDATVPQLREAQFVLLDIARWRPTPTD